MRPPVAAFADPRPEVSLRTLTCLLAVSLAACAPEPSPPAGPADDRGGAGAAGSGGSPGMGEAGAGGDADLGGSGGGGGAVGGGGDAHGWVVLHREDFERFDPGLPSWQPDPVPDDGPHADGGIYFTRQGIAPPPAFRISQPLSGGWLTAESYSRSDATRFTDLLSVVDDPSDARNHALKLASLEHTDATVLRSTDPLPSRYRISLRVGWPRFGDGAEGHNGYDRGDESAGPWRDAAAVDHNGFYWLTILDAVPRPHNNTWIHHHRKIVVDSCNHYPAWMEIFDGKRFESSGRHPIMMFGLDGTATPDPRSGLPFVSYAAGAWQPSGKVRAVDRYLPGEWYTVSIERFDARFTIEISGRFEHGGDTTYRASIDAAERCLWHFDRDASEDATRCANPAPYPGLPSGHEIWPAGETWPDYFMFGDPHENYYEGDVLYDDVTYEVWR